MGDKTGIAWTDATWNPVSGCSKVSAGCKFCYADREWNRLSANPKSPYFGRAFTDVREHPERLDQPLRWRRARRVFVNSMSDLFHEAVTEEFLDKTFAVMALAGRHSFQVLTKRPARMRDYLVKMRERAGKRFLVPALLDHVACSYRDAGQEKVADLFWTGANAMAGRDFPLPNVWLGVSAEDQETADARIPILLRTPAAVRFVSIEPLIAPVHIEWEWVSRTLHADEPILDWLIVGGESGYHARGCDVAWIRSIVQEAQGTGATAVFVKQLGSKPFIESGGIATPWHLAPHDRKGTEVANWPVDMRVQEFPKGA